MMTAHKMKVALASLTAPLLVGEYANAQSLEQRLKDRIEDTLTCADEATVSMSPSSLTQNSGLFVPIIPPPPSIVLRLVREIRPSAAASSADMDKLSGHASLVTLAYDMYEVQEDGGDVAAAFGLPGYALNGFIYSQIDPASDLPEKGVFHGFLVESEAEPKEDIIVLRGTMRTDEWTQNIRVSQAYFNVPNGDPGARVHTGFLDIYEGLEIETADGTRMDFQDLLQEAGDYSEQLTFVGHSLGGALAAMSAYETQAASKSDGTALNLVTFGSPRIGNYTFASFASKLASTARVCNMVDVVTTIPATQGGDEYFHTGDLVQLSAFDHDDKIDNSVSAHQEQVNCWHSIDTYITMLSGQALPLDSECSY